MKFSDIINSSMIDHIIIDHTIDTVDNSAPTRIVFFTTDELYRTTITLTCLNKEYNKVINSILM